MIIPGQLVLSPIQRHAPYSEPIYWPTSLFASAPSSAAMQIRRAPEESGAALVNLSKVSSSTINGLIFGTIADSQLPMTINITETSVDAIGLGVPSSRPVTLYWDLFITYSGVKAKYLFGAVVLQPSVTTA